MVDEEIAFVCAGAGRQLRQLASVASQIDSSSIPYSQQLSARV
jgi:hypothetical protein